MGQISHSHISFPIFHQVLRETCGKQLEAKNQELVERDEQISELTNQVDKDILQIFSCKDAAQQVLMSVCLSSS